MLRSRRRKLVWRRRARPRVRDLRPSLSASKATPLADAELALIQATNDYAETRNTIATLEAREAAEKRAVETTLRARDEAVRAVVRADPATKQLAANYQAT